MCLENQVLNTTENNTVADNATVINNFNPEDTTTKEMVTNRRVVTDDRSEKEHISMPAPGQLDAPHYWEIPDALVDSDAIGTSRAIPGALVNSTRQPTTDELGEAHYWEIPDALVHSGPNSVEFDAARDIPEPRVNSTCQPTIDDFDGAHYWNTIRAHRRPSSLPIDIPTNHNSEPRPPHQYWNNPDEDIDSDSTIFYASAAEPKFSGVTKSGDSDRLYKAVASSATTQTSDGHSIQATYRTDDVQTAFVAVHNDIDN
ncbi:hypothetical protein Bbelb_022170 [Branchiostoma belcheri]|nr:hypothetical protein Bbelb_022170 [Branchiostoma belcheri]